MFQINMNTKSIFVSAACAAALLFGSACSSENSEQPASSNGQVALRSMLLDVDTQTVDESRAEGTNTDNFIVELRKSGSSELVNSWQYSAMPELLVLPVGDYSLSVASSESKPAAFDAPLYVGSTDFTIEADKITNLGTVTCTLSNVKVSVRYSDALTALLDPSSTVTVTTVDGASLTYSATETRSGYFAYVEGNTTLVASFAGKVSGRDESITKTITGLLPGHHYILNFTVKQGGYVDPKAPAIDFSLVEVDLSVSIEGMDDDTLDASDRPGGNSQPEQPEQPEEPATDAITFTSSTLSFTSVNLTTVSEAKVVIAAEAGIANLKVDIISNDLTDEFLRSVGLAASFDLAYPGDIKDGLAGLGFPTGAEVIGQKEITFDITQFMTLLDIYPGQHSFRITVTDMGGATDSRTLTFLAQ